MKPLLIVIVGPTAIGKTDLSVRIAEHYKAEIWSADSRQFYQEMGIGTAKPTAEEMRDVPHHFVDFLSIHDGYTAGQFETDTIAMLSDYFKTNPVAIMVGGSGLYVNAVCDGLDPIPSDLSIRKVLNHRFEKNGLDGIAKELDELDPAICKEIDMRNPMRVIRALEVCLSSGTTYTSFRQKKPKLRPFEILKIGLTTQRDVIYDRINQRCDIMMEMGWEAEALSLLKHKHLNALNTVGYKELFDYFESKTDRETCVNLIKQHTRNFAKRQLTWFKKDKSTIWIDSMAPNAYDQIVDMIDSKI